MHVCILFHTHSSYPVYYLRSGILWSENYLWFFSGEKEREKVKTAKEQQKTFWRLFKRTKEEKIKNSRSKMKWSLNSGNFFLLSPSVLFSPSCIMPAFTRQSFILKSVYIRCTRDDASFFWRMHECLCKAPLGSHTTVIINLFFLHLLYVSRTQWWINGAL